VTPTPENPGPGAADRTEPDRLPETRPAGWDAGEEEEELPRMTLLEHLDELRRRILRTLVVVLVAFFACFAFAEQIYEVLEVPVRPHVEKLSFLRITDPFTRAVTVAPRAATSCTTGRSSSATAEIPSGRSS